MSRPSSGRPVGVFDSGVGGLSVLRDLRAALPAEELLYFADQLHCPYGERDPAEIEALTLSALRWLEARGCKLVVIACNTACAFSLTSVRAQLADDLPVVGLVPALKPAAQQSRSRVVGVLATPVTLEGSLLREVIDRHAVPAGVSVHGVWHRDLVPLVEAGEADSPRAEELLREVLGPLRDAGADTLVLGCTHYPFLAGAIRRAFGNAFALLDSGPGVARRVRALLSDRGELREEGSGGVRVVTSGDPDRARRVVRQLLGQELPVEGLAPDAAVWPPGLAVSPPLRAEKRS